MCIFLLRYIALYCTILHYTALAVVNLWIISPLPRGSVNSVTCSSEKFPRAFCSRLVGSDVETPLLNMLSANSWMQTLDKSKPRKKRHRRNKGWTQYTCTYNYIHVMRVTMIGNVSTKPCNVSMQVTFGAPSSSAGSSSSSSSSTAALWDPPVMERKHVQLPWHHVFHFQCLQLNNSFFMLLPHPNSNPISLLESTITAESSLITAYVHRPSHDLRTASCCYCPPGA